MATPKIIKTTACKKSKIRFPSIHSLPKDLFIEILCRVASSSFIDLHNTKMCCKDFLQASNEDCIFQQVSIDKFSRVPWKIDTKISSFLKRCEKSGNPEVLYREGMKEYFSLFKIGSGLSNLRKAAEQGHIEASYVYGIVLMLSSNDRLKQEGLRCLTSLKCLKSSGFGLRECRNRVREFVSNMWINKHLVLQHEAETCQNIKCCRYLGRSRDVMSHRRRQNGWESSDEEEDDGQFCEACKWYFEAISFCNMLRTGRF